MVSTLEDIFNNKCKIESDINEHMPTLLKYAKECETITEMGVRWITSTWAFLTAKPKYLVSYDFQSPATWGSRIEDVYEMAKKNGVVYKFIEEDVLKVKILQTDLLFIDTWHAYEQLIKELKLHSGSVNKYIILHDTETFAFRDEPGYQESEDIGLELALNEFLHNNKEWRLYEKFANNNGLTILKRYNG